MNATSNNVSGEEGAETHAEEELPSLDLIYGEVRSVYSEQFARLDTVRSRAGTLLAFTGLIVGLGATLARDGHGGLWLTVGVALLLVAAVLYLGAFVFFRLDVSPLPRPLADYYLRKDPSETRLQVLANTLAVIDKNEEVILNVELMYMAALAFLALGTLSIGVSVVLVCA